MNILKQQATYTNALIDNTQVPFGIDERLKQHSDCQRYSDCTSGSYRIVIGCCVRVFLNSVEFCIKIEEILCKAFVILCTVFASSVHCFKRKAM